MSDDNNPISFPTPPALPAVGQIEPELSFADLGLRPEVLKAVADMGFAQPMDVQKKTIPLVREGRDILVQSRTGSGKTAAFAIPFADWIADPKLAAPQALVLLPTRELALQVAAETARICATLPLAVVPVYGGSPMGKQIEQLRSGAHIVCGTPGRTLDHIRRGTLQLDRIKCVVLDECDEMLSMGFQEDIEAIMSETPVERQTLLFSATVPEGIQRLSRRFMRSPELLKLSADFIGVHEIRHTYYAIPGGHREAELLRVLAFEDPERAVIFCNTREETGRVAEYLRRQGLDAEPISSDLSQPEREAVMARMRAGGIRFLVATDIAARGIDIENLPCVINYTFPESPEVYIHRTGRTGRAGRSGHAISLIGPTEVGSFYYLKLLYKIKPEERSLPSEAEVRSHREGERLAHLRSLHPENPGGEWTSLARRLLTAVDAERLVGALLRDALGAAGRVEGDARAAAAGASVPEAPIPAVAPAKELERRERSGRGEHRGRAYGERTGRTRREGGRDRSPERSVRDQAPPDRAASRTSHQSEDTREFWEVWSEDVGRTPGQPAEVSVPEPPTGLNHGEDHPSRGESPTSRGDVSASRGERPTDRGDVLANRGESATSRGESPADRGEGATNRGESPSRGSVRLYVSLGRKDGVTPEVVAEQLSSSGVSVSPSVIELMNTHSYLNLDSATAERLCQAMQGRQYNGRAIVCEPARPPRRR
ncbi:MAG: DEAD/DEAH box helicase [Polyangia bacterium]|jgi:ATP-dependent RNA helicase DeaD